MYLLYAALLSGRNRPRYLKNYMMNAYQIVQKDILGITLLCMVFFLAGCQQQKIEKPPENADISRAITVLYKKAGGASSVNQQTILGKHYSPQADTWKIVACTEMVLANGTDYSDCNDSFELYMLDTGKWIVSGKINGTYRWLEVLK